jgi:uncharacterized protein YmfQ (DUF2313 family)
MSTQQEFLERLQEAMPPGQAWTRHPDAELTKLLRGAAAPLADAHNYAVDVSVNETCPGTTTHLIGEWEAAAQPYAEGEDPPALLADRRAAVCAKLVQKGDSSLDGLELIRDSMGYTATFSFITDVMRVGFRCSDRCYKHPWLSSIMVTGTSQGAEKDSIFMAAIRASIQAHVVVGFNLT